MLSAGSSFKWTQHIPDRYSNDAWSNKSSSHHHGPHGFLHWTCLTSEATPRAVPAMVLFAPPMMTMTTTVSTQSTDNCTVERTPLCCHGLLEQLALDGHLPFAGAAIWFSRQFDDDNDPGKTENITWGDCKYCIYDPSEQMMKNDFESWVMGTLSLFCEDSYWTDFNLIFAHFCTRCIRCTSVNVVELHILLLN